MRTLFSGGSGSIPIQDPICSRYTVHTRKQAQRRRLSLGPGLLGSSTGPRNRPKSVLSLWNGQPSNPGQPSTLSCERQEVGVGTGLVSGVLAKTVLLLTEIFQAFAIQNSGDGPAACVSRLPGKEGRVRSQLSPQAGQDSTRCLYRVQRCTEAGVMWHALGWHCLGQGWQHFIAFSDKHCTVAWGPHVCHHWSRAPSGPGTVLTAPCLI